MTTAGTYNYHPVIAQGPENFQAQLSNIQPPFFFGGSQVPSALGLESNINGEGIKGRNIVKSGSYKPVNKLIQYPQTDKMKSTVIPKILPYRK